MPRFRPSTARVRPGMLCGHTRFEQRPTDPRNGCQIGISPRDATQHGGSDTTMDAIIGRHRYSTETATLLADDEYADRSNRLQHGRATHLYRTPKGAYFVYVETIWQREHDSIRALSPEAAADLFETLPSQEMSFEQAFPEIEVVEA